MKLSQFKFKLPEDKIALHPAKYRDESRLMVVHKSTGKIEHKVFKDILEYFDDKDVDIILAQGTTDKGIGLAIMNRLHKASGFNSIFI